MLLQGCHDALQAWFQQHSLIMMIIGFAIGAVQVILFITYTVIYNLNFNVNEYNLLPRKER